MSDSSKSASPSSFGTPATSGNPGVIFGQGSSDFSKQGGGLFGSLTNPPATSAPNPFGNTSTAGGSSSVFGGGGSSNMFGGSNRPSAGFNFGQPQNNNTSSGLFDSGLGGMQSNNTPGGIFGGGQDKSQIKQPLTSASPSTGFSGFSTPNKSSEQPASGQTQSSNLFGGGSTLGFAFGNFGKAPSSATQENTTTPTSKPTTTLFGNSTTPAGPPPSTTSGAGSGSVLFGKPSQDVGNPFGNFGASSSAQGTAPVSAPPGGLGGLSFGASKSQESHAATSSTQSPSIFESTPNASSSKIFGNKRAAQPDGGLFGHLNKTSDTGANPAATSQDSQNEAPKPSLFNLGGQSSTDAPPAQTSSASLFNSAASKPPFSFSNTNESQPPTSNTVASPNAASSAFNSFNKPTSSGISAPSTSTSSGGLFPNPSKTQDRAHITTAESVSMPAPSSTAASPSTSLLASKPATPGATSQGPALSTTANVGQVTGGGSANVGASTAGPPPTAQSRLKNKSMDDIITRWASDLSKYQKEFQQQAQKVAAWDRLLVENSEDIQKLYGSTLEAERATTEVERQLTAVENDQGELSMWLDHYEREVDAMISNLFGQGDILSGPDQERERTYQMASKLQDRLDEMGKDLTSMIEEINDASSTLSKNSKPDDPLSQVVRVLNNHLTQLQMIDQGAAALQLKVKEAQRAGQSIGPSNGLSGPSSDAADGFYRSFMGRR